MDWTKLKHQTVKNIYYWDETGEIGFYVEKQQFYLIEQGLIYLELQNGSLFKISEDENYEVSIAEVEVSLLQSLENNRIEKDKLWHHISSHKIIDVRTHKNSISRTIRNKTTQYEVVSGIEILFQHGEIIFIENAGYVSENEIQPMTGDFILYNKRKTGITLNLIKNENP